MELSSSFFQKNFLLPDRHLPEEIVFPVWKNKQEFDIITAEMNGRETFTDMDRTLLKQDARERMRRYQPNPIVIGLIVFLLTWVLQYLSVSVLGLNFEIKLPGQNFATAEEALKFMDELHQQMLAHFRPSIFAVILAAALSLMNTMVNVGNMIYSLHVVREEKADYGNLLDGFSMFFRVIALVILEVLIISALTMLFIIPGLIFAYRYRQAMYLLIDHPDRSPIECLHASGELMRGHKWELFVLDLSFLGWMLVQWLLSPFAIWLRPYQSLTYANYYRMLRGEAIPANRNKPYFEGDYTEIHQEESDEEDRWGL